MNNSLILFNLMVNQCQPESELLRGAPIVRPDGHCAGLHLASVADLSTRLRLSVVDRGTTLTVFSQQQGLFHRLRATNVPELSFVNGMGIKKNRLLRN